MDQVLLFGLASSPFAIVAACVSDKWCGILAVAFIVLPISVRVFSIFDPIIDSQQGTLRAILGLRVCTLSTSSARIQRNAIDRPNRTKVLLILAPCSIARIHQER